MLTRLKEENKIIGTKQVKRALLNDEVGLVYLAENAELHVIEEVVQLCKERSIEIIYVESMKELGKACGIDVKAASAALIK